MFYLHCAEYFPTLEEKFAEMVRRELSAQKDPFAQSLVVVPTRALRKRLLRVLAGGGQNLFGVNILTINHLAIKVILDSSDTPKRLVSDALFFPYALHQLVRSKRLKRFAGFRTCLALYQTLRDLNDGGISPETFEQVLEEARRDAELAKMVDFEDSSSLLHIYREFDALLEKHAVLNLNTPVPAAVQFAQDWMRGKNFSSLFVYGFYDCTQTQFDLLETLIRQVHGQSRNSYFFFPFATEAALVEYPAQFAQPLFDRLFSLDTALGGAEHLRAGGTPALQTAKTLEQETKPQFPLMKERGKEPDSGFPLLMKEGGRGRLEDKIKGEMQADSPSLDKEGGRGWLKENLEQNNAPSEFVPPASGRHLASANIESLLFKQTSDAQLQSLRTSAHIDCFSSGGTYDEAWGIAKRILHLVRNENVSFDQITVIVRSLDNHLVPLAHVFAENRIPCDITRENTLSTLPFARFAYTTLLARLSRCNHATLFEMLSSPFLKQPSFRDFRNLEAILSSLVIRNWDDWSRLEPLLHAGSVRSGSPSLDKEGGRGWSENNANANATPSKAGARASRPPKEPRQPSSLSKEGKPLVTIPALNNNANANATPSKAGARASRPPKEARQPSLFDESPPPQEKTTPPPELPQIFDFIKEEDMPSFRNTVTYLLDLKSRLLNIPESETLPAFARKLKSTLQSICQTNDDAVTDPVYALLDKIADYSMLDDQPIQLHEFTELLKFYLQKTTYEAENEDDACAKVTIGDIMQLRGTTADYVFVAGLNKDIFPRRVVEDPFLPDTTRKVLRAVSGAGPAPKRQRLLPLKEGNEEELLLYGIALRSARKKLYVSYSRADDQGHKISASSYLDETIRLLTGAPCESNKAIAIDPKHHKSKFIDGGKLKPQIIPNQSECAILSDFFYARDLAAELYKLPSTYIDHVQSFARRMNSLEMREASNIDGCMTDPTQFWSGVATENGQFRISYSRFKNYLECPFKFFAATILRLQESPKDTEEEERDISQLMKGIISEDVVKTALRLLRDQQITKSAAVQHAFGSVRARYASIFPPLLLDHYLKLFQKGALEFIDYIEELGFDFKKTEAPEYGQGGEVELVRSESGDLAIVLKGIPDFVFYKTATDGLVVDLKWGTKSVINTPDGIFNRNEAQFCIYPAIMQANTGVPMPFQYFRLDAFCSYGSPSKIASKIRSINPRLMSEVDVVTRVFGGAATDEQCVKYFTEDAGDEGRQILQGQFRIIKDPGGPFTVCNYCGFTQICRKTHTGTLLRARQAETT